MGGWVRQTKRGMGEDGRRNEGTNGWANLCKERQIKSKRKERKTDLKVGKKERTCVLLTFSWQSSL